ncbi:MAG TPA: hypothetical protein PK156_03075 [Polyangium sp.]|nr:hypothetical protein [Polyangium sp.]
MSRVLWQEIHARFDPQLPARETQRAERTNSPVNIIGESLDLPMGIPRALLTGTIGTGKTTELFRIAEERRGKEFVIFLQLDRHFQETVGDFAALETVSPWEVCFLAGLSILRGAEQFGFRFPEIHERELAHAWQAAAKASGVEHPPEIDVAKLAKQVAVLASNVVGGGVGVGLAALGAVADAGKWSLPFGRVTRVLHDSDASAKSILHSVNTLIGLVQQRFRPILLIIDGLDYIKDVDRARDLFIDSHMISNLDCRMVVSGPFALRHSQFVAGIQSRLSIVAPLVNVPVLRHDDPTQYGDGIEFFRELYQRRIVGLGSSASGLLAPALLDKLSYYSGGRAREFVTMIRRLSEVAYIADASTATTEMVDRVLRERRLKQETGLHKGHLELLQSVVDDPRHERPRDPLVEELLISGSLLPYPNESEWYYPNPLLMMHKLRTSASSTKLS